MKVAENDKFLISANTDGSLTIYDKLYTGDVRLYVKQNEIDDVIGLLEAAKKKEDKNVKKFLVEYVHVEETTYQEWVEADSEEEAIEMVKEDPSMESMTNNQGIEIINHRVIDKEED